METWDAIRSRRNVRAYADRPIAGGDLDRVLEAARRTPSSSNQQRWDFVVCTDRQQLGDLSRVWRGAGHVADSAATIALVAPIAADDRTGESIQYDLGQATMRSTWWTSSSSVRWLRSTVHRSSSSAA